MELVKLIIASHKRPENCVSAKTFANVSICVPESQVNDYSKFNPNNEIISHPDNVVGLSAKFRWIHSKYPNVVIIDDDIQLKRNYIESGDSLKTKITKKDSYDIIQMSAYMAKQLGAKLFGFSNCPNPIAYHGHSPFSLSGFVIGGVMGFLEGFQMEELPDECVAATDYMISGINAHYNRMAWIDTRYYPSSTEGTFKSTGGMSDFRTMDTEKKDLELLFRSFGDAVSIKSPAGTRKIQHQYEKTLRIPY